VIPTSEVERLVLVVRETGPDIGTATTVVDSGATLTVWEPTTVVDPEITITLRLVVTGSVLTFVTDM
jgi:hypothetical protein